MRLHNRLIKASFWTDSDLLQWPREKRWFYEGLIQLADDSGCLEDSPFAFKLQLFPSPLDADITVEVVEGWIQELVAQGKLIRYEVGGKACLYLNNFHKHQSLRSPAAPDTPLPPWIKYIPSPKTRKSGTYEIITNSLSNPYADPTVTLQSPYGDQPEPEREPEPEINTAQSPDGDECDSADPAQIDPEYSTEFEHFWSIYPKRLEKKAAYKCWNTRLKEKHRADDMILAATNYARLCAELKTERRYIKHAATFLGQNKPFKEFVNGIPPDARGQPPGKPSNEPAGFQGIRDWLSGKGERIDIFDQ